MSNLDGILESVQNFDSGDSASGAYDPSAVADDDNQIISNIDEWNRMVIASNYDLPLAYHSDAGVSVIRWTRRHTENANEARKNYAEHRRNTRLTLRLFNEILSARPRKSSLPQRWTIDTDADEAHSARLSKFEPEMVLNEEEERQSYDFVRSLATIHMWNHMTMQLETIYRNYVCLYAPKLSAPFRMFSWSKHDFIERRRQTAVWVDVLHKDYSTHGLDLMKFKVDLKEFLRLFEMLFRTLNGDSGDPIEDILQSLEDTIEFASLEATLTDELEQNLATLQEYLNQIYALKWDYAETMQERKLQAVKEKVDKFHWYNPIEMRYRLGYCQAQVALTYHERQQNESIIERELKKLYHDLQYEEYRSECALNAYYTAIGTYKSRIAELHVEYARSLDSVENSIVYKMLSLNKLEARRSFLNEQMVRFREDIELIKAEKAAKQIALQAPMPTAPANSTKQKQAIKKKKR